MEEVQVCKAAESICREASLSWSWPASRTRRGCICKHHASDEPQQAARSAVVDISEAVWTKVASKMREAPVIDLVISDEESEEEPAPAPRRKILKSSKVRTM